MDPGGSEVSGWEFQGLVVFTAPKFIQTFAKIQPPSTLLKGVARFLTPSINPGSSTIVCMERKSTAKRGGG